MSTPTPTSTSTSTSTSKSTYIGATPPSNSSDLPSIPPKIIKFFETFYSTSDSPTSQSNTDYVSSFTPQATLIMGTRIAKGSEELMTLRKGLWTGPVKTRKHTLTKIFPWDRSGLEVMLFGFVEYGLVNGKRVVVDWAGRAELVVVDGEGKEGEGEGKDGEGEGKDGEGEVKMKFYQVYLDSAPVINAMKD